MLFARSDPLRFAWLRNEQVLLSQHERLFQSTACKCWVPVILCGNAIGRAITLPRYHKGNKLRPRSPNVLHAVPNSRLYQRPGTRLFWLLKNKKTTRITLATLVYCCLFFLLLSNMFTTWHLKLLLLLHNICNIWFHASCCNAIVSCKCASENLFRHLDWQYLILERSVRRVKSFQTNKPMFQHVSKILEITPFKNPEEFSIESLLSDRFSKIFKNSCVDRLTRADCGYAHLQAGYLNQQSYACGCRLNVMRAGGCWPNACESDMTENINAAESLWYKSVATFFNGGEVTGWSFQLSVILHELRSAWWQLALLNER